MPDAVIYPSSIDTDKKRLFACYSLVQQMIDEHNKQVAIAGSNKEYAPKLKTYIKQEFEPRIQKVLNEQNRLKESIRWANYTKEEWHQISGLPSNEIDVIEQSLFGNKTEERVRVTLATSPVLDELKAISLDKLGAIEIPDPNEVFTNYSNQEDAGSDLTIATNKITFTAIPRNVESWVCDNKGSGHFNGDFEFLFEIKIDGRTNNGLIYTVALANVVDDLVDMYGASEDELVFYYQYPQATYPDRYRLAEADGGSFYSDYGDLGTSLYFVTLVRDDDGGGGNGSLTAYIRITSHSGTLQDTLSLNLHSQIDFQYIYGLQSRNDATAGTVSGYVEHLDLQEGASYDLSLTEGIKAGDTPIRAMTAGLSLTEGLKGGESFVRAMTAGLSVTEGLKGGESFARAMSAYPNLGDGLKGGETFALLASMYPSLTEGTSLGEALLATMTASPSITDGVKMGETFALLFLLSLAEGIKAGDTKALNMAATLGLTEGTKLGEALMAAMTASPTLAEGIKAGDTTSLLTLLALSEGLKAGDAKSVGMTAAPSLTEGLKLGDSVATLVGLYLTLLEGIKAGDTVEQIMHAYPAIAEGIKTGDIIAQVWGDRQYPSLGTSVAVAPENDQAWQRPTNIYADDGAYAYITSPQFDTGDISDRLRASNFGFSIPSEANINGIQVEIERHYENGTAKDYRVQLVDADGNIVGDNKADTVNNWDGTPTIKSYGGETDTWGASLTYADINDADFGVVLSAEATDNNADVYVDFIRITVYYTTYTLYSLSLGEGVKVGETLARSMTASPTLTEGAKLGETLTATMAASIALSEGIKLGDTHLIALAYYIALTEGTKFGDTKLLSMLAYPSITDGINFGEVLSLLATMQVSVTDGVNFGDVSIPDLGVIYLSLTEGTTLGDTALQSMLANLQLSDGTKLGDSPIREILANLQVAEGITLGDALTQALEGGIYNLSLSEGVSISDPVALSALMNLTLADGTRLGDTPLMYIVSDMVLSLILKLHNRALTTKLHNRALTTKLHNRALNIKTRTIYGG